MSVMTVEGSQKVQKRCLSPCFRAVLVSFEAKVGEKRGFFEPKLGQNGGDFGAILPGLCLLGDKKV